MNFGQQYVQRGGLPMDNATLRRKEEQRRRQQEYAQALAQQVAQREQQKQRERELDRQAAGTSVGAPYQQARGNFSGVAGPPPPPTANGDQQQRGFFDGLGQNEYRSHTSFARGQRQPEQPPQWQQPPQEQSYYHQQQPQPGRPPSAINYAPPPPHRPIAPPMARDFDASGPWSVNNNTGQWPTPAEYHQLPPPHHSFAPGRDDFPPFHPNGPSPTRDVQSAWLPPDSQQSGFNANGFGVNGPGYPAPPSPVRDAQPQAQQFGRRVRTDINGGGEHRKVQQQLELQNALQLQIEEKNRQKLEAKRRKEEEDRREMERLVAEQRAHELEQERVRDEKRRRAEEEVLRAQQAAAAVAIADQKARAEQQQRHRATQQRDDSQVAASAPARQPSPPKNPFVDSRAHLFQDHSAPQLPVSIAPMAQHPSPHLQFLGNNGGYIGNQSPGNHGRFPSQQPDERHQQFQQGVRQDYGAPRYSPGRVVSISASQQHPQPPAPAWQSREVVHHGFGAGVSAGSPPIDPMVLMRQYDAMRQELARQQELMDQLHHAQSELQHRIQSQQQQEAASPSRSPVPTLTDLDRLRDELREELELRERMHRRELEALKLAHQQQQQQPQQSQSLHGGSFREQTVLVPIVNEQVSGPERSPTKSRALRKSSHGQPATSPVAPTRNESLRGGDSRVVTARDTYRQPKQAMQLPAPAILKSLDCDSKLVYLKGAALHDNEAMSKPDDRRGKRAVLEPLDEDDGDVSEVDPAVEEPRDSVDELIASSTAIRPLQLSPRRFQESNHGNQELRSSRVWIRPPTSSKQLASSSYGNNRSASSPLGKLQSSPTVRSARASVSMKPERSSGGDDDQSAGDTDDGDDALEFFVRSFPATGGMYDSQQQQGSMESRSRPAERWHLFSLGADGSDDDEVDDSSSMDGEQLEALFQRNLRRHAILLGFQQRARRQHSPTRSTVEPTRVAWAELHHQLEANREATAKLRGGGYQDTQGYRVSTEPALVGSSRWMPPILS